MPQGGPPPPGYGYTYGPVVHLRSTHPRARLQVQGPLKWQDVCVAPCNVPVNPQGLYRIGGGSIRPSEGFNMPRPSGQVVIDAQTGSTVKHWVGIGLMIATSWVLGLVYLVGAVPMIWLGFRFREDYKVVARRARDQAGENERAGGLCDELANGLRDGVGQFDRSAWNGCTSRIHHDSRNLARDTLGVGRRQHCQQQTEYPDEFYYSMHD